MGSRWKLNVNRISRLNVTTLENDAHHASFADQVSLFVVIENRLHHAFLETVDLDAGIAQTRDLNHGRIPEAQSRPCRQREQINSTRCDVLAYLSGRNGKSSRLQFIMELSLDEMNLTQVGLAWIFRNARAVLHRFALMGIAVNA
jgi:hypothetical protein